MRHLALPFFCAVAVGLLLALLAWALRNQVDAVALGCAIGAVFFAWRCWEDLNTSWPAFKAELQILRHALGVGDGGLERSYRSHFVTGPGGTDHQHCMALVERGFMVRRAGNAITGGSDVFNVTQAGRAAVQEHTPPPPKLTRSQQRYQQFLRYDGGVTFGEYLRGWR